MAKFHRDYLRIVTKLIAQKHPFPVICVHLVIRTACSEYSFGERDDFLLVDKPTVKFLQLSLYLRCFCFKIFSVFVVSMAIPFFMLSVEVSYSVHNTFLVIYLQTCVKFGRYL